MAPASGSMTEKDGVPSVDPAYCYIYKEDLFDKKNNDHKRT